MAEGCTVGSGPGLWFGQLVALASFPLQQREYEGHHGGCGNTPYGNEHESCSWGRSRAGESPVGSHPPTPVPLVKLAITGLARGGCFPA